MQVRYALNYDLRREEFVQRAQLFPASVTADVELHVLSQPAREALAICNPDLPELYELLAPDADDAADAGHLWQLRINPNAYSTAEIVEMWAKEWHAAQDKTAV